MKIELQDVQGIHDFKQPLSLYTMGVSGTPETREQKAFVACLMAEFPQELGEKEMIDKHGYPYQIYRALRVATADFYGGNSGKQMQKYRKMGYQKGTPDITIMYPVSPWHGFVCEMKAARNQPTSDQSATLQYLSAQGYYTCVGRGFAGALNQWIQYLQGARGEMR